MVAQASQATDLLPLRQTNTQLRDACRQPVAKDFFETRRHYFTSRSLDLLLTLTAHPTFDPVINTVLIGNMWSERPNISKAILLLAACFQNISKHRKTITIGVFENDLSQLAVDGPLTIGKIAMSEWDRKIHTAVRTIKTAAVNVGLEYHLLLEFDADYQIRRWSALVTNALVDTVNQTPCANGSSSKNLALRWKRSQDDNHVSHITLSHQDRRLEVAQIPFGTCSRRGKSAALWQQGSAGPRPPRQGMESLMKILTESGIRALSITNCNICLPTLLEALNTMRYTVKTLELRDVYLEKRHSSPKGKGACSDLLNWIVCNLSLQNCTLQNLPLEYASPGTAAHTAGIITLMGCEVCYEGNDFPGTLYHVSQWYAQLGA